MVPNLTVKEFVALGRFPFKVWNDSFTDKDWSAVRRAISLVGINHLTEKDITEVSDGERHRSMIALALAQNADIILLDEPTAFLDLPNKFEMVRLLAQLAHDEGKSIIYSTHDLQVAIHEADNIWMMLDSCLVSGAPEDLILANQFDSLLSDTSVVFDTLNGVFKNKRVAKGEITIVGEGIETNWTIKMLERIGYSIAQGNPCRLKVVCKSTHIPMEWDVYENQVLVDSATNLLNLAAILKRTNKE
jgi:iron complex transport system ATP-binding protein